MMQNEPTTSNDELLGQAANEFFQQQTAGQSPNIDEFAARYPQIADQIRLTFPALELVGNSISSSSRSVSGFEMATGNCLGDFRIVRELGRGGMGVVYEAEQQSIGRRVAIKVMPFAALAGEKSLQRFRNEVRAAASLSHPNIVSIYSVGQEEGVHYYAMQLILGTTLANVIRQLQIMQSDGQSCSSIHNAVSQVRDSETDCAPPHDTTKIAPTPSATPVDSVSASRSKAVSEFYRSVASLGQRIAEAVEFAHENGIVHRDIKPANLLLDGDGQVFVADFGLARIESEAGVTMTGDLVGTLRYMSPEQALNNQARIDHRTDIYSIGITLYELLCLRAAFPSQNRQEVLKQIAFEEPITPRKLEPGVPIDLETIVLKAISKAPEDRYQTSLSLAQDLKNFLDHRPVVARRAGAGDRVRKWIARHPTASVTAIVCFALISVVLSISSLWIHGVNGELSDALKQAADKTIEAEIARQKSETLLYAADLRLAGEGLKNKNVAQARERLTRYIPQPGEEDRRCFVWHYVWNELNPEKMTIATGDPVRDALFTPDGKRIIAAHDSGNISAWDATNGKLVSQWKGHDDTIRDLAFSHDGSSFATAGDDGRVAIWDTDDLSLKVSFVVDRETVWAIRFTPDGKLLTATEKFVSTWDGSWEEPASRLGPFSHSLTDIAISTDGKSFAVAAGGRARIYEFGRQDRIQSILLGKLRLTSICFSPDGRYLVGGDTTGELMVWDPRRAKRGKPKLTRTGQSGRIYHVSFSADGEFVATASKDMTVHVRETKNWETVCVYQGHTGRAYGADFSNTTNYLLTSSSDGTIKLWDPKRTSFRQRQIPLSNHYQFTTFDPYGNQFLIGQANAQLSTLANQDQTVRHANIMALDRAVTAKNQIVVSSRFGIIQQHHDEPAWSFGANTIEERDIDGDGDADLVAGFGRSRRLIWQENRNGSFRPAALVTDSESVGGFIISDYDGNGTQNVIRHSTWFYVDQHKHPGRKYAFLYAYPHRRELKDMTGDRRSDLLITRSKLVELFVQQPDGLIENKGLKLRHELQDVGDIVAHDIDRDGWQDVVAVGRSDRRIMIWKNENGSQFKEWMSFRISIEPLRLDIQDANNDGFGDIICAGLENVVYFRGTATGFDDNERPLSQLKPRWLYPLRHNIALIDRSSLEITTGFYGNCNHVESVAITDNGTRLASAGDDHVVRLWDANGNQLAVHPTTGGVRVYQLQFSSDGKTLAAATGDHLQIFDGRTLEHRHHCTGHQNSILNLDITHDNRFAITSSEDLTVRIWELETGNLVATLVGNENNYMNLAISADDRLLATGDETGTVRIWDLRNHQELLMFTDFPYVIRSLAFDTSKTLTVVGTDGRHESKGLYLGQWKIE